MDKDKTGAHKEIYTLHCPIFQRPKDKVIEALRDIIKKIVQFVLLLSCSRSIIFQKKSRKMGNTFSS